MDIPSPNAAAAPCRICTHAKADHPAGMFGCVKAIGLCRCPCWQYEPVTAPAQSPTAPTHHSMIGRREAENALERWAEAGLKKLSGLDSDGARDKNDVGFSKYDSEIGHSLAHRAGLMTDKQWIVAVKIARKYWRQIGEPPTLELK